MSTLCARTNVRLYPCIIGINNHKECISRAENHCKWLSDNWGNSMSWHFEMQSVFDSYTKNIGDFKQNTLALANAKSRLRMMTLYQVAAEYSGIVVGTGNKVEDFGVGFYTKYGDGGVDISPIADLYKTEVRELGRYLGINQEILDAAPTDGLWSDNRTDEEQIGATYEELEWAMEQVPTLSMIFIGRQQEVMKIYNEFHNKNQHKMLPIPIYKLEL